MIKTITVTNDKSESVVLDLRSPEQSGFFIRGITGLGPVKADINTTESLSFDGSQYNSARLTQRNIVFDIGFLEKPTIEDVRLLSYKYFPIKRRITIEVETDNRTLRTIGYVESNEPSIFSKDEGSTISVICPDAYFRSLATTVVNFSSITSQFEFPFSNESLTENLIVFSDLEVDPQSNVVYTGEAPVGFRMYIHVTGPVGTFTVYNLGTREYMVLDADILEALTGSALIAGDEIIISTVKGDKYVTLIRDGEYLNILNALGPDSTWFTLSRGDNVIYYVAESGEANLQFRIEFEIVYEGV